MYLLVLYCGRFWHETHTWIRLPSHLSKNNFKETAIETELYFLNSIPSWCISTLSGRYLLRSVYAPSQNFTSSSWVLPWTRLWLNGWTPMTVRYLWNICFSLVRILSCRPCVHSVFATAWGRAYLYVPFWSSVSSWSSWAIRTVFQRVQLWLWGRNNEWFTFHFPQFNFLILLLMIFEPQLAIGTISVFVRVIWTSIVFIECGTATKLRTESRTTNSILLLVRF